MSILNPDQVFASYRGVLVHHALEAGFQLKIKAFGLAVSFRVISGCQTYFGSDESAEFPPEPGHQLGPPVFRKPVDAKNIVHHYLRSLFSRR